MIKKEEQKSDGLITQSAILSRFGWTKTLILKILGEPDLKKKIRGYDNFACLYAEERVILAEKSDQFSSAQASIAKRKIAAKKAVQTKIAKILADVEAMEVSVEIVDIKDLRVMAINSYNEFNCFRDSYADMDSDKSFLNRITVNFIRHEMTCYDGAIEEAAGRVGVSAAILKIQEKIYSKIAEAYPFYGKECKRQYNSKKMSTFH